MNKKTHPIYLHPDHLSGILAEFPDDKKKTFVLHHQVKQQLASYRKQGLSIHLLGGRPDKGLPKEKGIFVAADRILRQKAIKAGHLAAPNLAIAHEMALGGTWIPVYMILATTRIQSLDSLQSYFVEDRGQGSSLVIGLLNASDYKKALCYQESLQTLRFDPASEDLVWVQTERGKDLEELPKDFRPLISEGSRFLFALGSGQRIDDLPLHGAHGHNFALFPDTKHRPEPQAWADFDLRSIPLELQEPLLAQRIDWWKYLLKPSTSTSFAARNGKYSGLSQADATGTLESRHILHPDNLRTENALFDDLSAMGYSPQRHSFQYGGATYHNIVADLAGTGRWRLKASLLQKMVREFQKPDPDPTFVKKELDKLKFGGGEAVVTALGNSLLELLRPYRPWWRHLELLNFGADLLLVGCHLDSTAASTPGYQPATDAAPGRDDNASGIAATLEMANYFRHFKNCFNHTIRFCFFNAEEQGMVGSKAYAQFLKYNNAPVKAAICTDMIGYNSDSNHLFEIHAGYTSAAIRDKNLPFANEIATRSQSIFGPGKAQIYQGTNGGSGSDRLLYDGAINRSDHAAFHEQGYPAVVVSEDFFINLSTEPASDGNPNYHRQGDTFVDSVYASKITCAIARAVKEFVK